jgi:hypothetical protein
MPVVTTDTHATLAGVVAVEDAETLTAWCAEHPGAPVVVDGLEALHTAALPVLLAIRPPVTGVPADPFLRDTVMPWLAPTETAMKP